MLHALHTFTRVHARPGSFSGYSLEVSESHQSSKADTSGTAKDIVGCFQKMGLELDKVGQQCAGLGAG